MPRVSTCGGVVATVAAMGAAMSAALVSPAAAAAYACSDEHMCLYGGHVGQGATFSTHDAVSDLRTVRFNDRARSVFNSTSHDWCLYQNKNFGGEWRLVEPGEAGNLTGESDRAVSSLRPEPECGC
ncbi:peptidase inhibitor family I36 protein [Streptomyces sp. NPDC047515]|uniref:peptidase inhibitor family I36 protein n=1 Tax=Streptomyces sp. NPDC047515 TaxID=3155380 RepID=UPI0033F2530D